MFKTGTVLSTTQHHAVVQVIRTSACGEKCGSCKGGCSVEDIFVEAINDLSAERGDIVEIEAKSSEIMGYASLLYILPLMVLIGSILAALKLFPQNAASEMIALAIGFGLMAISFFLIHRYARERTVDFQITRIHRHHVL